MSRAANLTVNDTGFLGLPTGTNSQRPVVIFNTPGSFTWTCPVGVSSVQVLIVAGGGGGGWGLTTADGNGGGGAGGLVYHSAYPVAAGYSYGVTVGAGGVGGTSGVGGSRGANGSNSQFAQISAIGGGGGGSDSGNQAGLDGGSGGGASASGSGGAGGNSTQVANLSSYFTGSGGYGFGNAGGASTPGGQGPGGGGGGGGGAGTVGGAGAQSSPGGNGGSGLAYSISGNIMYYAGGGGGGSWTSPGGRGGAGGGGLGASRTAATNGTDGAPGTGGGGGGGAETRRSGAGGSGCVIISWTPPEGPSGIIRHNSSTNQIETFSTMRNTPSLGTAGWVTKGLACLLDAGNTASYPGTGNVWYDISGNNRHFYINSTYATWTSAGSASYFTSLGTQPAATGDFSTYAFTGPASDSWGFDQDHFIEAVALGTSAQTNWFFHWAVTPKDTPYISARLSCHFLYGGGNSYYDVYGCCDANTRIVYQSNPDFLNQLKHVSWRTRTSEFPQRQMFRNGASVVDSGGAVTSVAVWNKKDPAVLCGGWQGRLYYIAIYNRALTDQERMQNYAVLQSRYGIS